jgi:hypothetical protein
MSEKATEYRDEAADIDEQERQLRNMLGSEQEYLLDLAQAGMDAATFGNSPVGRSLLVDLRQQMLRALRVLRDPAQAPDATMAAVYQLRVAVAATESISSAIAAGHRAELAIDQAVS